MGKKRRHGRTAEIDKISLALVQNGRATLDEQKRKHWSKHDIKAIQPLTDTQDDMFHAWYDDKNICAHGSAGTGKTFLALYLAINEVLEKRQSKIIVVRSAVTTRKVGHLPGTLDEKIALYELPYKDIMWELVGRASTYQDMKDAHIIDFQVTSFIRGLTWDNAIIIVDEVENMTFHEIDSIMTRLGENSRIIFTGDIKQTDLDGRADGECGLPKAIVGFNRMKSFAMVEFTKEDIVRSELVKDWIIATDDL